MCCVSNAYGMPVVAVIGDGQLARMMQTEAIELGVETRVLAASDDASAAQVFGDVRLGGLDLRSRGERTHVGVEIVSGRELHGRDVGGEAVGELVGDRLLDVDAFDRDTQLAGVGVAGPGCTLHRVGDLGALGDDHRVLAPEFGGEADEPTPRLLGQRRTRGGRAGEHQVVARIGNSGFRRHDLGR